MKIIGDIGNTEVKICLIDNKYKIKKKINYFLPFRLILISDKSTKFF